MKLKHIYMPMLVLSALLSANCAMATLPVFDYGAYTQLIIEIQKLKSMVDLTKNMKSQLHGDITDEIKQLTGQYGFGDLDNSASDLTNREWSPDNWQNALKGLSGGNAARYKELVKEYREDNKPLSESEFAKGTTKAQAKQYEKQVAVNQASQVQASYAFNDIKHHLQTVHDLSQKIDDPKNKNAKSAMDLNARLTAELAYISIQELKMQSVLNQQLARSEQDKIAAESRQASFDRLPDE